mgnify:FL=1|tara:strand:+ start:2481 stop:3290 length:810 start_codon:yes stop_codon:yes gene_type:complete
MEVKDLRTLIKEVHGEKRVIVYEAKFSHIRQIMMGVIPSIDTVGILTGENPGGQRADRKANRESMKALERDLRGMNYGFHKIQGKFGSDENSMLVPNMTRDDAVALGIKYGQEAVIWGEKLADDNNDPFFRFSYIEGDDTVQNRDVSLSGTEVQTRDDYFSQAKGRKFFIPFFDDAYEGAKFDRGDGVQVTYRDEEIPEDPEARKLAESLKRRSGILAESSRTKKSLWHHRGMMNVELKKLQEIVSEKCDPPTSMIDAMRKTKSGKSWL